MHHPLVVFLLHQQLFSLLIWKPLRTVGSRQPVSDSLLITTPPRNLTLRIACDPKRPCITARWLPPVQFVNISTSQNHAATESLVAYRVRYLPVDLMEDTTEYQPQLTEFPFLRTGEKNVTRLQYTTTAGEHLFGVTYEVRVAAVGETHFGPESSERVSIPEAAPSDAPNNFRIVNGDETSIHLAWSPPRLPYRNGKITQYQIRCYTVDSEETTEQIRTTTYTELVISDLPAATHACFVRAWTVVGAGPWSNRILFRIHSKVTGSPPPPDNIQYTRLDPMKVRVSWMAPVNSGAANDVVQFAVYYREESTDSTSQHVLNWSRYTTEMFASSVELVNLNDKSTYALRVTSVDRHGNEGPSSPMVYIKPTRQNRTEAARTNRIAGGSGLSKRVVGPDHYAVRNLKCAEEEPDRIILQWFPPAEEHHLVEYQVQHTGRKEFITKTGISKVVHLGEGVLRHVPHKSGEMVVSGRVPNRFSLLDRRGHLESLQIERLIPNGQYEFTVRPIYKSGKMDEPTGVSVSVVCRTKWIKPNEIRPPELEALHPIPIGSSNYSTLVEIRVFRVSGENGPIHRYFVIVAPDGPDRQACTKRPGDLSLNELSENALTPNRELPYLAIATAQHRLFKVNQDSAIVVLGREQLKRGARSVHGTELVGEESHGLDDENDAPFSFGEPVDIDEFRAFNKPLHPQFTYCAASRTCSLYPDGSRLCASSEWSEPIYLKESTNPSLVTLHLSPSSSIPSWHPTKLVVTIVGLVCGMAIFAFISVVLAYNIRYKKRELNEENAGGFWCQWNAKLKADKDKSMSSGEMKKLDTLFLNHQMYDDPPRSPCSYPSLGSLLRKSSNDLQSPTQSSAVLTSDYRPLRPSAGGLVTDLAVSTIYPERTHYSHLRDLCGIEIRVGTPSDKHCQSPSSPSRSLKSCAHAFESQGLVIATEEAKQSNLFSSMEKSQSFAGRIPIPMSQFVDFVSDAKHDKHFVLADEFHSIERESKKHCFSIAQSTLDQNQAKNRCTSVVPFDYNRVQLRGHSNGSRSDYINASYIDGYQRPKAYIATQAPLPETMKDFWTMVWEQQAQVIVMLTRFVERGEIQCDRYWPLNGSILYGSINVTHLDATELAYYTMRTFWLQNMECSEQRKVWHLQYTNWPEEMSPIHSTTFLLFMRRIGTVTPVNNGPLLLHCSLGAGRTGLFIAIDILLEQIKNEHCLEVYSLVNRLRAQRMQLVATLEEYDFIYHALREAIIDGNTEIFARNLGSHMKHLSTIQPTSNGQLLYKSTEFKRLRTVASELNCDGYQVEFRKINAGQLTPKIWGTWSVGGVTQSTTMEFLSRCHRQILTCETAGTPANQPKNRVANAVPFDWNRVCLHAVRGVDGSDYINASFVDGYRVRNAYIAAQSPMASTVEEFWRMIWEHRSIIIVMMCDIEEGGREQCFKYWPTANTVRYQFFVIDPISEYKHPGHVVREFKITDARDGESRIVRQLQYMCWPEHDVPTGGNSLIDLIGQVHKMRNQTGSAIPITVHCSTGTGRTGVFIALCNVLERLRQESVVDMYQTIKLLRQQRMGLIQTEQQYRFCYTVTLEYLSSFDLCAQPDPVSSLANVALLKSSDSSIPTEFCALAATEKMPYWTCGQRAGN